MKRRTALASALRGATLAGTTAAWMAGRPSASPLQAAEPGRHGPGFGPEALAAGPSAVVLGNPRGDLTMVEFFDYQCPYCRRVHPDVEALAAEDPNLRLVHKHWPVLGAASVHAAKVVLASRWQEGRYPAVHDALMRLSGRLDEGRIREAAQRAGLDMAALERDLDAREATLDAALREAAAQARSLRLQGTPAFVIGRYLVPGAVDLAAMRQAVARVRGEG